MTNMTGLYNFNELCLEARASAPWVKKVQRLLNLGDGEGSKGSRTYYTFEQVHIYSAVKKLRLIDIEFDEIKHIYEIEKKLESIKPYSSVASEEDVKDLKNIFSMKLIILLPPGRVLCFHGLDSEKNKELENTFNEYNDMQIYVQTKTNEVKATVVNFSSNLEEICANNARNIAKLIESRMKG
jgi:hypothetical protein